MTTSDISRLPVAEFAFPGPLRDKLVAAILDGTKTSTTGVLASYEIDGETVPKPQQRSMVVDSDGDRVAVIEVTSVVLAPLAEVDLPHAVDEGEDFTSVALWRAEHERFWHGDEMRAAMRDPQFTVNDATMLVLERFRLVADLRDESA